MDKVNRFKRIRVIPKFNDFVNALLSLKFHQNPAPTCTADYSTEHLETICHSYEAKVRSAETCFLKILSRVVCDFPCLSLLDPLFSDLLNLRYDICHYHRALVEVDTAMDMIRQLSWGYVEQLENGHCGSLDQCKRLKVTALACMLTVVKSSIPSLDFLDKIREYMASLPSNFEDVVNAEATLANMYHPGRREKLPVPYHVFVDNVADLVDPETMTWLEELERVHGLRVKDEVEVDCAQLAHTHLTPCH